MRWDLLTRVPFVLSLVILALNDWILKAALHNTLTGKLSDFAGLFALGVFLCAFLPGRERRALAALALAFAFWKSPLAGPPIAIWNALPIFDVGRVIDYTDLAALVMLPVATRYATGPGSPTRRVAGLAMAAIALVLFTATSRQATVVPVGRDYTFDLPAEDLLILMDVALESDRAGVGAFSRPDTIVDVFLRTREASTDARIRLLERDGRTALHLVDLSHRDKPDRDRDELIARFEREVIGPLQLAAADDSILTLVRLTQRPRRVAPIAVRYWPGLVTDPYVFGVVRFPWARDDSMEVVIANMTSEPVELDYCEVARDRLENGAWVAAGPAFDRCHGIRTHLEPQRVIQIPFPTGWDRGIYRMRAYFDTASGRVEVATDPIVFDPRERSPRFLP